MINSALCFMVLVGFGFLDKMAHGIDLCEVQFHIHLLLSYLVTQKTHPSLVYSFLLGTSNVRIWSDGLSVIFASYTDCYAVKALRHIRQIAQETSGEVVYALGRQPAVLRTFSQRLSR
jgi:hypothetical protein